MKSYFNRPLHNFETVGKRIKNISEEYFNVSIRFIDCAKFSNIVLLLFFILTSVNSYAKNDIIFKNGFQTAVAYRILKNISYNKVSVDVIVDKPVNDVLDVLLVYHGTATYDSQILIAANRTLDKYKGILDRQDMMIISVVYPEENLLFGDNLLYAEAALLWLQNIANQALDITINKIFLSGHSQGGYLVTRLNALHETNGVIASAPGPLNLRYRCQLEEEGVIINGLVCNLLRSEYGTTIENPNAYNNRSLLNFTNEYKSDVLFVQGLQDGFLQMFSWPTFKQQIIDCTDCQNSQFLELPNHGHPALFESPNARIEFNAFIDSR